MMKKFFQSLKNNEKSKIVLSFIVVVVLLVLLVTQVFAWFYTSPDATRVEATGMQVSVKTGEEEEGVTIEVVEDGTPTGETSIMLFPGHYAEFKVNVQNNSADNKTYRLSFSSINILYPNIENEGTTEFDASYFQDKYVFTNSVYAIQGENRVLIDDDVIEENAPTGVSANKDLFLSFLSPCSNAVDYAIYSESRTTFDQSYQQQKLTTAGKPTLQTSPNQSLQDVDLSVSQYHSGTPPITINDDGTFDVSAETDIDLYLVLYFDPSFYAQSTYTTELGGANQTVELQNSNAFMNQTMTIELAINEEPTI